MVSCADGEFCRKKSTIPSGMQCSSKYALNAFINSANSSGDLAAVFFNMESSIVWDKPPSSSGVNSTFNDFKLHKEESLTSNISGTKDRI
ncbi:hypothetical protein QL285_070861 [Trifolium repens]|jgi:hypothetical protein|nr:hypothetical protein QL285_070861 [Trifolium repens]